MLVDFVELQFKSKQNFAKAMEIILTTGLKTYMEKFVLLQPGDWPSQFFSRKLVYTAASFIQQLWKSIQGKIW